MTLSGAVRVDPFNGGTIRIDVFDGDQRAAAGTDARPSVVAMARLDAPGPFEVRVPKDIEKVWLGGFVDEDGDGRPSPDEPFGWCESNPIATVADSATLDLVLRVESPE